MQPGIVKLRINGVECYHRPVTSLLKIKITILTQRFLKNWKINKSYEYIKRSEMYFKNCSCSEILNWLEKLRKDNIEWKWIIIENCYY